MNFFDHNDNEGVPIRKLFVSNFPFAAKSEQLKSKFQEFGPIQDIYLHKGKVRKPYAFVTFQDESGAKKAREKSVIMSRRKLVIRAADPWHQPDFKDVHEMVVDEEVEQNVSGTILMLNDDCLLKIFGYLSIQDLLRAEKVCWRFRNVAEMLHKSYRVFDSERYPYLSVSNLRSLLYNTGPYVTTLRIKFFFNSNRNTQLLRFAALYCCNVTEMKLQGIEVSYKVRNIQNLFKNLRKLEIESCSVTDQDIVYLMRASENKTITELNLSSNQLLDGRCLSVFGDNLRVANFYSCSGIKTTHFVQFLNENSALEELNIVMCDKINDECIKAISRLGALKKLAISNGYSSICNSSTYSVLKNLTTLRHLEIHYVNYGAMDQMLLEFSEVVPLEYLDISSGHMTETLLRALMNFKSLRVLKLNRKKDCDDTSLQKLATLGNLEELSIVAWSSVTDVAMKEVVRLNPNIKTIDLTGCYKVSSDLIPILKEITKNRAHSLTLRAGRTDLANELEVLEFSRLDSTNHHDGGEKWSCLSVADNLKVELSSTSSSYLGSSDEASSDEWMDEFWGSDFDDSSELSDPDDDAYLGYLVLDALRHGDIEF